MLYVQTLKNQLSKLSVKAQLIVKCTTLSVLILWIN